MGTGLGADRGFLNVDVVVEGSFDRAVLRAALGESVFVLQDCEMEGVQRLAFESSAAAESSLMGPVAVIQELLVVIEHLPPPARAAWDAAERRVFDLGFQTPGGRGSWGIDTGTLAAVVAVGGEVAITVYV